MLWEKSFGNVFDTQNYFFFRTLFLKKIQKKFGKFFKGEKFFKIFFEFFFLKVS